MKLKLIPINNSDLKQFKLYAQQAFQKGFEERFDKTTKTILPERDIDQSLNQKGSIAYKAMVNGDIVGGAIIVIDEDTQNNHLDLLFVKCGIQNKGIGKAIWFEIEKLHPQTKVWVTYTPYFERRNIHFYVNVCRFHIIEFFNEKHPIPNTPEDFIGDGNEGMFKLKKQM